MRARSIATICDASTQSSGLEPWTSSLRDSPASRSVVLEASEASKTSGGSGPTSGASPRSAELARSSSRTSPRSAFAVPLRSFATLTTAGGMRSGMCFERVTWAHLTGARGGSASLWPTATTQDNVQVAGQYETNGTTLAGAAMVWATPTATPPFQQNVPSDWVSGKYAQGGSPLSYQATKLWQTPAASHAANDTTLQVSGDGRETPNKLGWQAAMWQTPGTDSFRSRGGDRKDEMGLDQQARHWPTPVRADGERGSGDSLGRRDRTTETDGSDGSARAVLNPSFVETLQGYPDGWTDCVVSETPSSRGKPSSRSTSSTKG